MQSTYEVMKNISWDLKKHFIPFEEDVNVRNAMELIVAKFQKRIIDIDKMDTDVQPFPW